MALLTLSSAGGSPGVTTTVVGLALTWPRPILVIEADPTGTSAILPGYRQGQQLTDRSVIDLAIALRQGHLRQTLLAGSIPLGARDDAWLIPAIRTHRQAAAMASAWEALADEFAHLDEAGMDVLVDAGRLGLEWFPSPLVFAADVNLLVSRCTLPALAQAKVWVSWFAEIAEQRGTVCGLALIGAGQPYSSREIGRHLGLPVTAELPDDPRGARVFSEGRSASRRLTGRAPLSGALRALSGSLLNRAHQTHQAVTS